MKSWTTFLSGLLFFGAGSQYLQAIEAVRLLGGELTAYSSSTVRLVNNLTGTTSEFPNSTISSSLLNPSDLATWVQVASAPVYSGGSGSTFARTSISRTEENYFSLSVSASGSSGTFATSFPPGQSSTSTFQYARLRAEFEVLQTSTLSPSIGPFGSPPPIEYWRLGSNAWTPLTNADVNGAWEPFGPDSGTAPTYLLEPGFLRIALDASSSTGLELRSPPQRTITSFFRSLLFQSQDLRF